MLVQLRENISQLSRGQTRDGRPVVRTINFHFGAYCYGLLVLLIGFGTLSLAAPYLKKPILCKGASFIDDEHFEAHCWNHGTYLIQNENGKLQIGKEPERKGAIIVRQKHTQWIGYFLALAGAAMYLPRLIWDFCEAGQMTQMCEFPEKKVERWVAQMSDRLGKPEYQGRAMCYLLQYYFTQVLNPCITVVFLCVADALLDQRYMCYMTQLFFRHESLLNYACSQTDTFLAVEALFPPRAGCFYSVIGASGGGTNDHHGICQMPINTLHRIFFPMIFIYCTFLLLTSAVQFLCTLSLWCSASLRRRQLSSVCGSCKLQVQIRKIASQVSYAQFHQLVSVGQNVSRFDFDDLVKAIGNNLRGSARGKGKVKRNDNEGNGVSENPA